MTRARPTPAAGAVAPSGPGGTVIETAALTRRFGELVAVNGVSLDVREGEVFGLLGHNGAGKTTLIRLLNGVLAPTGGTARVLGHDPYADGPHLRRLTGVLTESSRVDEYLTARETLAVYARLQGVPARQVSSRVERVVDLLHLARVADRRGQGLSAGWRRRVALARALVHDPELLFLDEPTANLDPVGARTVRRIVSELAGRHGRTIVLCTHNLHEAQALCDRLAILREGRVLAAGSTAELARQTALAGGVRVEVAPGEMATAARILEQLPATSVSAHDSTLRVGGVARGRIPELVTALVTAGIGVFGVAEERPSLEDVYLSLHGEGRASRDGGSTRTGAPRRGRA